MIETLNALLKKAVESAASDLFITVAAPPTMKVNGQLVPLGESKLTPKETESMIHSIFKTEEQYKYFRKVGELDFSYSISGLGRFRVGAYTQRGSHAAVIRIIKFEKPNIEKLKIPEAVLNIRHHKSGLVLVTGPTGSGKSTTLSCLIDLINQERTGHILTLEDPIEYIHRHNKCIVNQREVGVDTLSYADGLRAALRHSPDVILIGEMRDYETISTALTAAETGHLVLSTLHTFGAAKTIDRIIDVFPPNQQMQIRLQLSSVLKSVVTQQLFRTESGERVPAFEIMNVNHTIKNLIREGKIHQIDSVIHSGQSEGMIKMDHALALLVKNNIITEDQALSNCISCESLKNYLQTES